MNILELIKAACKKAGVDEKHAERIKALFSLDKPENVDASVALFKDNVLPALTEAGNDAQKEAKKKAVEDYEKKHGLKDGKVIISEPDPNKTPPIDDKLSPEIKALIEAQQKNIKDLTDLVSGVVKTQTNSTKLEDVKVKLKGKIDEKYIEKYAKRVNLDAEDIDAEIETLVTEFTEFKQDLINEHIGENYRAPEGRVAEKSVEEWTSLMNKESKDANSGTVDLGL